MPQRARPDFAPDFTHVAEMGFTHAELLKGLPTAAQPYQITKQSERVYWLCEGDRRACLTLAPETSRAIATLTLPVTVVTLEFFGFSEPQFADFMRRYKRYLHKGGG